jgi:phage shock protein C
MQSPSTPPIKRLYRSTTDYKIAGVCGGLGEYFAIDSTWIRLLFILFLIAGGSSILVYIICWLIMPIQPK